MTVDESPLRDGVGGDRRSHPGCPGTAPRTAREVVGRVRSALREVGRRAARTRDRPRRQCRVLPLQLRGVLRDLLRTAQAPCGAVQHQLPLRQQRAAGAPRELRGQGPVLRRRVARQGGGSRRPRDRCPPLGGGRWRPGIPGSRRVRLRGTDRGRGAGATHRARRRRRVPVVHRRHDRAPEGCALQHRAGARGTACGSAISSSGSTSRCPPSSSRCATRRTEPRCARSRRHRSCTAPASSSRRSRRCSPAAR